MLAQLQTVRIRLGLTELEVQWDGLLTNSLLAVSARFNQECNRVLARTENIDQEFCAQDREVVLRCYPIESVSRFELKSSEQDGWQIVDTPGYLIRSRSVVSLKKQLGSEAELARVIYTGGYVLPGQEAGPGQAPLPADLEQAAVEQVCYWFLNRERLGLKRIWEYHGTYRDFIDLDLLSSTRAVLARHTRMSP